MRSTKPVLSAAITTAAVLAVGACGSSGTTDNSFTVVAQAAGKTAAAKNAKVFMELKLASSTQTITLQGGGVTDLAGGTFQVSLALPAGSTVSGSIDELVVGNAVYLRFPAAMRSQTAGKEWVSITPSQAGTNTSANAFGQDLSAFLKALGAANHDVKTLGRAKVRGVQTTHYRAVIDLSKAAKTSQLGGKALDQYRAMYGTKPVNEDVYIDDQGLARRVSMDLKPGWATGEQNGPTSESITLDFYDFGKADTAGITAPPKSDTIDVAQTTLGSATG